MSPPRLILASKSTSRRALLAAAGLEFDIIGSSVDESKIKEDSLNEGMAVESIAALLATSKALDVGRWNQDALTIGCDQVLLLDGKLYDKPRDMVEARDHLLAFRGKRHVLISAIALCRGNTIEWTHEDRAEMHVREFSDTYLENYLEVAGEDVLSSVGVYKLEGPGATLFREIRGDYFTVLGLPLLPLLEELRNQGILVS